MHRLMRVESDVEAGRIVAVLRGAGVRAVVGPSNLTRMLGLGWRGRALTPIAGVDVFIGSAADEERAWEALEGERAGGPPPAGWEEQASAGVGGVDPSRYPVSCPSCGERLPMDGGLSACPSCGAGVDVAELVVHAYGPEVLAEAGGEGEGDDGAWCGVCGAHLSGGAVSGRCADCGTLFDRREGFGGG